MVFGVTLLENVTEYEVRCETALSRARRMAAIVVLYALLTRCWFITGTRLSTAYSDTMMVIATTIIISSRLNPPARCRLRPALIFSFFNPRSEEHTSELQSLTHIVC